MHIAVRRPPCYTWEDEDEGRNEACFFPSSLGKKNKSMAERVYQGTVE
ncbi:MAG TPA: hypothetical protein PLH43_07670 [Acetivibrio sp.]|nr:hypothetical protein [Acetivibrio sp.]HOM02688.1 hypothetical protein [Acetivibrio sp.]HOV25730.1 hypothetical protein [Pseudobacteroides sp.]